GRRLAARARPEHRDSVAARPPARWRPPTGGNVMAKTLEVKVPDIGDFGDVPVIEVLVAVGDTVAVDEGLVLLESDKATMEVPSTAAGVVKELRVKEGDSVSEGQVVAVLEAEGAGDGAGKGKDEASAKGEGDSDA